MSHCSLERGRSGRHQSHCDSAIDATWPALCAAALISLATLTTPACAQQPKADAAHAIAEKFAADAERSAARAKAAEAQSKAAEQRRQVAVERAEAARRKAEIARRDAEQRKADEAEMLARARAEAESRRHDEARARAERAEADAVLETARRAAETERAVAASAARAADQAKAAEASARAAEKESEARRRAELAERARLEEERINRERAEAAVRAEAAQQAAAAAAVTANQTAEREAAGARDAEERLIEEAKRADAARRAMEAEREAENAALAAKLRRIEDMHAAEHAPKAPLPAEPAQSTGHVRPAGAAPVTAESARERATAPAADVVSHAIETRGTTRPATEPAAISVISPRTQTLTGSHAAAPPITRVTVLLRMEPGNKGIRRHHKTADPVLCIDEACYVSKGPDSDAWRAPRMRALGSLNTLGGRADACNQSLGCVFRNVDLGAARNWVQPVDLRIMRHDRRDIREIAADPSCIADAGRLVCSNVIDGGDYRLWVVPEPVAEAAGPDALRAAVATGLANRR